MTKATLFVLCASLCLSFAAPFAGTKAYAQTNNKETHKAPTANTSADRTASPKGLLADGIEVKKKISTHRQLRDAELRRQMEREALEAPGEELYGDDSWTQSVNPFAGMSVNIPNRYDVNLDGFVMPIERRQVTSHYGYRASFGRMHYGTDLALSIGDTVRAAYSGKVRIADYEGGGYGHYLVLRHPNGLETVYGHLHRRLVSEGTIVKAGDPIALGGNTGRSTGPHLHFEARFMGIPLNPSELFDFHLGAPRQDVYAFVKNSYNRAISRASMARAKASKPSENKGKPQTYRVRRGDTLAEVASKYGMTVNQLKRLNGLRSNKVKPGKSLRVS